MAAPTADTLRNSLQALSQSCDVAIPERLDVQVAPVVTLPEAVAADARVGKRPRYAHLPQIGPDTFADLDCITTVSKSQLVASERRAGVISDEEVRRFAAAVARKFGRYAFPDEVAEALEPLRTFLVSKAPKELSPVGQVLRDVAELRIEASNGWQAPPYELVLILVVEPGTLPTFAEDELPPPASPKLHDRACG
jgi:hypothetical protein